MQSSFWQAVRSDSIPSGWIFACVCERGREKERGCIYVIWKVLRLWAVVMGSAWEIIRQAFSWRWKLRGKWKRSWRVKSELAEFKCSCCDCCQHRWQNGLQQKSRTPLVFIDILFMTSECNLLIKVRVHSGPEGTRPLYCRSLHAKGPTRASLV